MGWRSPPLFTFDCSRARIVELWGRPLAVDLDSNGLGLFDVWAREFDDGTQATFWWYQLDTRTWEPRGDFDPNAPIEVYSPERDMRRLVSCLGLEPTAVSFWEPFSFATKS